MLYDCMTFDATVGTTDQCLNPVLEVDSKADTSLQTILIRILTISPMGRNVKT
jgi:hypothetical protein